MTDTADDRPRSTQPSNAGPSTSQQPEWPAAPQPVAHVGEGTPYSPEPTTQQWPVSAPPAKSKKTGLVVVSILAVLFLGAAGAFGGLYLSEKSDHNAVSAQLVDKDKTLADKDKALSDAAQKADTAVKAQQAAESKALGYQACHDTAVALLHAAVGGAGDAAAGSLGVQLFTACS
jgi:uncharacterized protein HemX